MIVYITPSKSHYFILLLLFLLPCVLSGQNSESPLNRAEELISSGKFREAIFLLNELNPETNNDGMIHFRLGLAYRGLYQFDRAKTELEKAAGSIPDNPEILYALGGCYKSLDLLGEAETEFRKVTEIDSGNSAAAVDLAGVLIIQNKFAEAAAVYGILIGSDSTNSYFYKQLGSCLVKTNNLDSAVVNYEKSLKYNPKDAGTYARLAQIFYRKEMLDTAAVIIEKGLAVQRMNQDLNRLAAEIYFRKNNYFGSVKHLLNVIVTGDSTSPVYQKLGLSYYLGATSGSYPDEEQRNIKLKEGIEALNIAFAKDSTQSLTKFYLGVCYKELGDFEKAAENLNEALALAFPDYLDDIYTHLALSYELKNDYGSAIENFQKALKENPLRANNIYYLAALYDKYYSDKTAALNYYKKFLREAENADEKLISYTKNRIEKLREEIHFNHKK